MRKMNVGEFRRLSKEGMEEVAPVELLFEGEPIGLFVKKDDVMVISDLHIRVRNRFKAQEAIVRMGMPKG